MRSHLAKTRKTRSAFRREGEKPLVTARPAEISFRIYANTDLKIQSTTNVARDRSSVHEYETNKLEPIRPRYMDKDHRLLPRFADIQPHHPDRNARDDDSVLSERLHSSPRQVESRTEPAPTPLHPPVQSHSGVRAELLYQQSSAIHRQPSQPQLPHQQRVERHNPSPPPVFSQPIPVLSNYDRDRIVHSQSPSMDNVGVGMSNTPYPSYSRQQQQLQHQQGAIVEGGVAKPKKLHREVEQKRRMRMAEQIVELRKWVSNPNGGKTDKVSVLQDAVTYVKESAKKIEDLQRALEESRAECARLRSFLNKSQPISTLPGPLAHLAPPQAHVAPISHLNSAMRQRATGGMFENEMRHPSQFSVMQTAYEERHVHPGGTDGSQGTIRSVSGPSNFVAAPNSSLVMRGGPSRQPASQGFGTPIGEPFPSGSIGQTNRALAQHHSQAGLRGGYYRASQEVRMMTSGPGQSYHRPGRDDYQIVNLPRLRGEDEEQQRSERQSES